MNRIGNDRPALIVIGGFAGAGKTSLAKRLSTEFSIPCLSSDASWRWRSSAVDVFGIVFPEKRRWAVWVGRAVQR